jgi:hypothetical protein
MREGWNKQLSLALPLGFLDQEQARATKPMATRRTGDGRG